MAQEPKVPVRDCVGEALRFTSDNRRFIVLASAAAAGALVLLTALALFAPLGIVTGLASTFVRAAVYAAFIAAMLFGASAVRPRLMRDAWRVWASMAIVGLFMFLIMFVASIPGMIVLITGPLAPYVSELTGAGDNQAQVVAVLTRFAQEEPLAVLLFTIFYAIVWLLLTSRLYLAAPASLEAGRILTFETWRWTRGAVLSITWARIMLLAPAYVLVSALDLVFARLLGLNAFDPAAAAIVAQNNPFAFLAYVFATSFITLAIYASLEAGLSTSLFRLLRQAPPAG
jgi:hypothetical protein